MKTTDILLNHIRNNPGCISADIYESLKNIDERRNLSSLLSDLTKRGMIYREEVKGENNRAMFKYWDNGHNDYSKQVDYSKQEAAVLAAHVKKEQTKPEEKLIEAKERYFVLSASGYCIFSCYDTAKEYAKKECEVSGSASIAKVILTMKRVVTIVEEPLSEPVSLPLST